MTDHGQQTVEARRPRTPMGEVGQSFADAWGAVSVAADPYAGLADLAPTAAPAAQADSGELVPTSMGQVGIPPSVGQGVSVTVSRPLRGDAAAAGSSRPAGDDRLTVEVRREGGPSDAARPAERIVVTVSLNGATEQIAVAL